MLPFKVSKLLTAKLKFMSCVHFFPSLYSGCVSQREEEQRKEEERRRVLEDRRRLEKERVQNERREADERDRKMNEKLQMIENQRFEKLPLAPSTGRPV